MANGHGGARPGAGRKPGTKLVRTQARPSFEKAASDLNHSGEIDPEITKMKPLDVLLKAMWIAVSQGNWSAAASFAREAGPYVHAKMSSVDISATIKRDPAQLSDDELIAMLAR